MFGPHMLRKFPPQSPFMRPPHEMERNGPPMMREQVDFSQMDRNTRRDFFGEKLFTRISSNPRFANSNA